MTASEQKGSAMDFTPQLDPTAVRDLRDRLDRARWPEPSATPDWSQGVPLEWLQQLTAHWRDGYDWSRFERGLTRYPQVRVTIDGLDLHALHIRSPRPDARPLLLAHGWPSSPFEFAGLIEALSQAHGGSPFHLVCPSLPGYGFSQRPTGPGWGRGRIAAGWVQLMERLGYRRFAAHGGDWGAIIATQLAVDHPERVDGLHLTMPVARVDRTAPPPESDFQRAGLSREADYRAHGFAYAALQATRPQTLGYGLVDSPVALCAWIAEKLHAWSDRDATGASLIDRDAMLDVVSLYWLTATGASSARLYAEALRGEADTEVTVPTACSIFPAEIIRPPRDAVERRYPQLVFWHEMSRGGHFPALEVPQDLAAEILAFGAALDA